MAVEISPRMARGLISLSESRPGMVPILGDARQSTVVSPLIRSKADWIHQDLSIADQAENFVKMAMKFLIPGGVGLLSLKAASERSSQGDDNARFHNAEKTLNNSELSLLERIELRGLEEQHVLFVCELSL